MGDVNCGVGGRQCKFCGRPKVRVPCPHCGHHWECRDKCAFRRVVRALRPEAEDKKGEGRGDE